MEDIKYPWFRNIFLPYAIITPIVIAVIYYQGYADIVLLAWLFVFVLSTHYLFFEQFQFVNFSWAASTFKVSYPISFLMKNVSYKIVDVEKIDFCFNPGPYGSSYLKVYSRKGRKRKHFCLNKSAMAVLIDYLRKEGVNVGEG